MNEKDYILIAEGLADETESTGSSDSLTESTESSGEGFHFPGSKDTILDALDIVWKGILAIFIVIAVIIAIVSVINLCVGKAAHAKKLRENPELAAKEAAENEEKKRLKAEKKAHKNGGGNQGGSDEADRT